ncbi:MAG: AAA family ATPase [Prevotella sp.]|nr:AAA family ATPase [Prevotella sp.]
MEKERLVVRNFGPITNLDIEFRQLTLFIGDQGSGKSTVSKLLTICRDLRWWLQILENAESDDVMRPFYDFSIDEYFHKDSYFEYRINGHKLTFEDGKFFFTSSTWTKDDIMKYISYSDAKLKYRGEVPISEEIDDVSRSVLDANARMILYILAERNLVGNLSESLASMLTANVPLPKPLLEYMSWFEKAKRKLVPYNIPFLGVRVIKKNGLYRIELVDKDKDLPLSSCSSGLQSVIPMLMIVDYTLQSDSFDSFVVEEPEQNLFPENQYELLGFFTSKLWDKKRRQFIITTHSPYLLSSLNVLMLAYKLQHIEEVREAAEKIIVPGYTVNPDEVAVYSLTPDAEDGIYCKSLISEKTGLVSVNELDSVSEVIGDDFDRLYNLYRQVNKKK